MLEWLDRYMAKFAQTDHIRREEHARRQEKASPAHEEAVALLEAFPYSGPGRARVIAAALSAITQETLLDAAYARRLLRAMVEGFSQADADVQTTLAPAQVALNLLPTLRAAATAGGSVGAPFALIEGTLAMRTGQFDVAIKRLGDANRELRASLVEDWSELLPSSLDGDMLPAAVELAADTLSQLENPDLRFWTVALCVIATVAVGHFFIQRWFDRKAQHAGEAEAAEAPAESTDERLKKAFEGAGPMHYALLPVLPLVLLIVFSPMVYDGIKLSLQTGLIVSIIIAFVVDFITRRSFRESTKNTQAVFEGMGKVFTSTVGLICCAELFALGMNKLGGISTLISMAASMESAGVWVMLLIMLTIMVVATVVTGSGNAAFFAFSPLLPEAAASVGINAAILAVPVQLSAGIARTMCPIAGVIIAVSGIAGLSPFELVRRTAPVMILALIMNVAASAIFL